MSDSNIKLKIYGVRGSYPPTQGFSTNIGVNTTCLRVDIGKNVIIMDAGTGIINLGNDLMGEIQAGKSSQNLWKLHLFFSHTHIDHLMGFPYFLMNYIPKTEMHIFDPHILTYKIEGILDFLMSPALFPVTLEELPATREYYQMRESKVVYFYESDFLLTSVVDQDVADNWQGKVTALRHYTHPKGGSYVFKFESPEGKSIVFATDVEEFVGGDKRLAKFSQGADVLIHDAQYSLKEYEMFQGFGHSTYQMACETAKIAGVKKLVLFHHDPKHTDENLSELETAARKIFRETYMANEKMEFII